MTTSDSLPGRPRPRKLMIFLCFLMVCQPTVQDDPLVSEFLNASTVAASCQSAVNISLRERERTTDSTNFKTGRSANYYSFQHPLKPPKRSRLLHATTSHIAHHLQMYPYIAHQPRRSITAA
ncbi:hypothetical protein B0H14DRAFT_2918965 [Mycena olivaceomarginata]|nr:hypothetical protein B0H14DRAFT_2918965 [Mycena olivaceomarginata]